MRVSWWFQQATSCGPVHSSNQTGPSSGWLDLDTKYEANKWCIGCYTTTMLSAESNVAWRFVDHSSRQRVAKNSQHVEYIIHALWEKILHSAEPTSNARSTSCVAKLTPWPKAMLEKLSVHHTRYLPAGLTVIVESVTHEEHWPGQWSRNTEARRKTAAELSTQKDYRVSQMLLFNTDQVIDKITIFRDPQNQSGVAEFLRAIPLECNKLVAVL